MAEHTPINMLYEESKSDMTPIKKAAIERVTQVLLASDQADMASDSGQVVSNRTQRKRSKDRNSILTRSVEVLARAVPLLEDKEVDEILSSSDASLLVEIALSALDNTPMDRQKRVGLKGAKRFHDLIQHAGGSVTADWVADLLNSNAESVRKQAQRRTLIARRTPAGTLRFPRFQFDEAHGQRLPGLDKLLRHTKSWSPEAQIRFLLVRHDPEHSEDTPLALLKKGRTEDVIALANTHMEQRP